MVMPGEIWLLRHGETEWSLSGQHTSRTDLPLTPAGVQKAAELRRFLSTRTFSLVLSSPLQRALDTARLGGYAPEICDDLREWDYGDYEGLTTPEIQRANPGWTVWSGSIPHGETAEQVGSRAERVIRRVVQAMEESKGADVALFSHGHFLRILGARWTGLDARSGRLLALSTGSVSVLGYERSTRVIRLWNQTTP
jgi:broad specificity phosphatase PhoE